MATEVAVVETEWVPTFGFGDRLRKVRRKKHRSQDEMAALLGMKKVTYASWEAGRTPSLEEVQDIARRLHQLDRVPQWWTLGADAPDQSAYGSEGCRFESCRVHTPRRRKSDRHLHIVPPLRIIAETASSDGAEQIPA